MEQVLVGLLSLLLFSFLASSCLIIYNQNLQFDFSAAGFNNAIRLFQFPLACGVGIIGIVTVQTALAALTQSTRQSAAATWQLTQSNFLTYVGDRRTLSLSTMAEDPFPETFDATTDPTELFQIVYQTPTTTLRRLYAGNCISREMEPSPSPILLRELARISINYKLFQSRLGSGDPKWIPAFVDLAVSVRQLRLYLAVTTESMKLWNQVSVLESNEFGGKRRLPPYSSSRLSNMTTDVRAELLCIVDVLHFSARLESEVRQLLECAFSVGSLWSNATPHLKSILTQENFNTLWQEPHRVDGSVVSI